MSVSGYRGRRFKPWQQYVVSLSKILYLHCFSRLSYERVPGIMNLSKNPLSECHMLTLDIVVDEDNLEEGALTILKFIRPQWVPVDVTFKYFTGGITNKLIGCQCKSDTQDIVLIRVNGKGTEVVVDRDSEVQLFRLLATHGCAPPLYAIFRTGLAYGFCPGCPLDEKLVREEAVALLIAERMVTLHCIRPKSGLHSECSLYTQKAQSFLDMLPTSVSYLATEISRCIPSRLVLQSELGHIHRQLESLHMPIVFSHNDLLLKNIIYDSSASAVHFIDFEYAFMNYEAYDIGNHFCEYAGVDQVDYSLYPDKEYQFTWLRNYLQFRRNAQGSDCSFTEFDVERLYVQTNKCACAAHFFWGLWALIQAKISKVDFDFIKYAMERLNEYFKQKENFFPLALP